MIPGHRSTQSELVERPRQSLEAPCSRLGWWLGAVLVAALPACGGGGGGGGGGNANSIAESEPNNNIANANDVGTFGLSHAIEVRGSVEGIGFPGDNMDMFRVQAEDDMMARAFLTPSPGVDIVLRIFDESGTLLDEADEGFEGEPESSEGSVDGGDVVIVAIFAFDDTDYTLQLSGSALLASEPSTARVTEKIAELQWIPTSQGELLFVTLSPHALPPEKFLAIQRAALELNLAAAATGERPGAPAAERLWSDELAPGKRFPGVLGAAER